MMPDTTPGARRAVSAILVLTVLGSLATWFWPRDPIGLLPVQEKTPRSEANLLTVGAPATPLGAPPMASRIAIESEALKTAAAVSRLETSAALEPAVRQDETLVPCPQDFDSDWFLCCQIAAVRGVDVPDRVALRLRDWQQLRHDLEPIVEQLRSLDRSRIDVLRQIERDKLSRGEVRYFPDPSTISESAERRRLQTEINEASRANNAMESVSVGGDGKRQWVIRTASTEDPRLDAVCISYWRRADEIGPLLSMALARMPNEVRSPRH